MKSENSTAQIKCTSDSSMHFYQSQGIRITNLEFIGCGGNQVRYVKEFVVKDAKFEGQESSGTTLELSIETTVQIVNSTFLSNRKGSFRPEFDNGSDGFVGGAIIVTNSTVDIHRSRFEDNVADCGGAVFAGQDSIISMSDNVFVSNKAISFGGVLCSERSTITIEASQFHDNSAGRLGRVLASTFSITMSITIDTSQFHDNNARWGEVLASVDSTITIQASGFHDNSARDEGGVATGFNQQYYHNRSLWIS